MQGPKQTIKRRDFCVSFSRIAEGFVFAASRPTCSNQFLYFYRDLSSFVSYLLLSLMPCVSRCDRDRTHLLATYGDRGRTRSVCSQFWKYLIGFQSNCPCLAQLFLAEGRTDSTNFWSKMLWDLYMRLWCFDFFLTFCCSHLRGPFSLNDFVSILLKNELKPCWILNSNFL